MGSERLTAVLHAIGLKKSPIDKLIVRLQEELELGYYKDVDSDVLLREVIKWAQKYKAGDE